MVGRASKPRIQLLREVATGPASVVFAARREGGRDLVAVKVLRQRTKGDVERLLDLRDASREVAALGHRGLVCTEDAATIGEFVGLVSPYVDGIDLLDWMEILREEGMALPGRVTCEIVRATASALDAALHRLPPGGDKPLGRVHRDIRPTNLMVDRDGELQVLDLGTGFTTLAGRSARAGALKKGIIKYMSPRRREGKRGGPAADVYSLGIVAIELFRGRWLRRLRSQNPAHDRHLAEVVARLRDLGMRSDADELALRNVLLRMVAWDQDARPGPAEVANTFRTLADRARGPSLEHFVHDHAVPWMEDLTAAPEADLEGIEVVLLEHGMTDDDLPSAGSLPGTFRLRAHKADTANWEETGEGWRQAEWELPDEIVDPFFDDDADTADAPLPGTPPLAEVAGDFAVPDPDEVTTASHHVPSFAEPEPLSGEPQSTEWRQDLPVPDEDTVWGRDESAIDAEWSTGARTAPRIAVPAPAPPAPPARGGMGLVVIAAVALVGLMLIGAGVALGLFLAVGG